MPTMWFEVARHTRRDGVPAQVRHLFPLGEHEQPADAADAIAAARELLDVPADDVRDMDEWQLTVHLLHGDEELPDVLLEQCTVHAAPAG